MIQTNIPLGSSISATKAKVDVQTDSTLVTCTCKDFLEEFTLYREGDTSKFFGFGVSHKMAVSFIDLARSINIQKGNTIEIHLGDGEYFDKPFPTLYIAEIEREEKSNTITCTAFDALYKASGHVISELGLEAPYTLRTLATKCGEILGLEVVGVEDAAFDLSYPEGANFAGDEVIRVVLDAIAEVTQTIYYINHNNKLVFKRLDRDGAPVLTITKKMYYELSTLTPRTLTTICHATELGDNIYAGSETGVAQIMRDNPLLSLREDLGNILDTALERVVGLTITQLNCDWEGDHCVEIGDKIGVVTENEEIVHSYVLDDVIEYQGFLNQITSWEFTQDETATVASPTSVGDRINQTVAKVDKVNKEITLMVDDVTEAKNLTSALQVRTGEISASVKSLESITTDALDSLNSTVSALSKEVNLKVDSEAVTILVEKSLEEGVDKVKTSSKKYTFDDAGLDISSSDSEISTLITEDGMRIYKNTTEVLTANNQGVVATDLHARTFLIIGENSRLEDRGRRTACFWIGPAEE